MKDKLVFVKKKGFCQDCYFDTDSRSVCSKIGACSVEYSYKEEEPKDIQTEYEWKKERLELIKRSGNSGEHSIELHKLDWWLDNNKPEKWETCTFDNTKDGDSIRDKNSIKIGYKVKYILTGEQGLMVLGSLNGGSDYKHLAALSDYEIDINKEGK